MNYLIFFYLFVLGLIVGSFLNVVILRFNTGMSISKGRSKCFACGKTLRWYELIPVFSFLIQKGKCRGCASKISKQYISVEILSAITLPLAYVLSSNILPIFLLTSTLFSVYIIMGVYDFRHKIIPDFFSYLAGILALALIAFDAYTTGHFDFARIVTGPSFFLFFFIFWYFSKGRAMGLGDGKLALSIGWVLGPSLGISALLISFWTGTIFSFIVMIFQKLKITKGHLGFKSEIPFGPFIIISFFLVLAFHFDIQTLLSHLAL